jgi:Tfp pilus assembly protein PilW
MTLIELLVPIAVGLVVLGGASTMLLNGLHAERGNANRSSTLQTLQVALGRMINELRPVASVDYVPTKGGLGITLAGGASYDCFTTAGTCVRTAGGSTTQRFADGLTNSDVFTLECRGATGNLVPIANGAAKTGCAPPANSFDYVAIRLVSAVPCTGQGTLSTSACPNGTIEVDGGTSLRNQP